MGVAFSLRRCGGLLLATTLSLAFASPSDAYRLRGGVIGSGATPAAGIGSGPYAVLATTGQPAVGTSGNAAWTISHGYWSFGGARVVGAPPPVVPTAVSFGPAVPNPARGDVRFELGLPHAAMVRMVVLDVSGRVVDEAAGAMPAGRHVLRWTAGSRDGRAVSPGIYFARLLVDGRPLATRRVVRLAKG